MINQLARRLKGAAAPRATSVMERAPECITYALHVPYCLYLMARYRGITLPTIANPGLDGSGLSNESKTDLFSLLGPVGRAHVAPFVSIDTGPHMLEEAADAMRAAGLTLPAMVKPDIGRRGFGVKLVRTQDELAQHLARFHPGTRMLIQRYAEGPGEAGMFYMRMPSQPRGRLLSLTIKHFPYVMGDGSRTLRQLILDDPRARAFSRVYFRRNRNQLDDVLAPGQKHQLVSLGNHVRGAAFENGTQHITPALEQLIDTIVGEVPGFFIGRFDVRYTTLDALKRGQGLTIVEYNGAGGEPTYIWDPHTSVRETYAGLLRHCKYLYAIGAENRMRGARPMPLRQAIKRFLDELRLLKTYPDEE